MVFEMKDNTFDVSGYHFAIMLRDDYGFNNLVDMYAEKNDSESIIQLYLNRGADGNLLIVDFDQIDGLTLDEFSRFKNVNLKAIFFAMYDKMSALRMSYEPYTCNSFYHTDFFNLDKYDKDMTVDRAVEEELKKMYLKSSEATKRRIRCFLQRYRYDSIDEVKEILGDYSKDESLDKHPLK